MSTNRCKFAKVGKKIDKIGSYQDEKYNFCSQQIRSNPLYTDQTIEKNKELYDSIEFASISRKMKRARKEIKNVLSDDYKLPAYLQEKSNETTVNKIKKLPDPNVILEASQELNQNINTYRRKLHVLKVTKRLNIQDLDEAQKSVFNPKTRLTVRNSNVNL